MSDTPATSANQDESRFCPDCGYELRGITSARCPECGMEIDWTSTTSPIPWEHRKSIGRASAFYRTWKAVAFRPRLLSSSSGAPLDYRAGNSFRKIVSIFAAVPVIALVISLIIHAGGIGNLDISGTLPITGYAPSTAMPIHAWEFALLWSAGATMYSTLSIGILLTFLLASGIASIWFHAAPIDPRLRRRAITLSQYACAPLAALLLPALCSMLVDYLGYRTNSPLVPLLICDFFGGVVTILGLWYVSTLRIFMRSTRPGVARLTAAFLSIPALWLLSAAVGIGIFPAVVGLVWVMIDSLR